MAGPGGTSPDGGAGQPTANRQACQRLKGGPFATVTGLPTYTFSDPGPPVQNDGKAYRVSLPPSPKVGHVSFKVPAAGEYVFFANRGVPIAVFTWDGTIIGAKTVTDSVSDCTEVKARESFELSTDSRAHVIRLGPDATGSVDLVVTAAP
jgi:hypothetical protein